MILNKFLDITLLKQNATKSEIDTLCRDALKYNVAGVCVNPCFVKQVSRALSGSGVKPVTVIGFPLGANTTEVKLAEAMFAMECGAREVDVVINYNLFKTSPDSLMQELAQIKHTVIETVKVIIETSLLTPKEIEFACEIAINAGADYVKTSTGFGSRGASVEDVHIMKSVVDRMGRGTGIKASGGIYTREFALQLIEAGATRLGVSKYLDLVENTKN